MITRDSAWSRVQNLVVGRFERTADLLLAEPTLAALAENLPDARLTLWMSPNVAPTAPIVAGDADLLVTPGWVEAAEAGESGRLDDGPTLRSLGDEAQRLHGAAFDSAMLLTRFGESPYPAALALRLAGVPLVAAQTTETASAVLSDRIPPLRSDAHQVHRDLHLVEALGFRVGRRRLSVSVAPTIAARSARLLLGAGLLLERGYVVLAAGGRSVPVYPPERFAEAGRRIVETLRLPIVLVGRERDAITAGAIQRALGDAAVSLVGATSPVTLAALLADASAYVGNATWPMYLADAVGTPGVLLWGGDLSPSRLRPRSPHLTLLRRRTDCGRCAGADCSNQHACLDVPPAEVADAIVALLGDRRRAGERH